jgi:hypothetical protein
MAEELLYVAKPPTLSFYQNRHRIPIAPPAGQAL